MKNAQVHTPVILLLENGTSDDGNFIRQWLSDSRFMTCEADNAFEVLEEISDFTVRERPDVIILNVDSPNNDLRAIREIVKCGFDDPDPAIICMSHTAEQSGADDFYAPNARQVAARLEKLLPSAQVMAN